MLKKSKNSNTKQIKPKFEAEFLTWSAVNTQLHALWVESMTKHDPEAGSTAMAWTQAFILALSQLSVLSRIYKDYQDDTKLRKLVSDTVCKGYTRLTKLYVNEDVATKLELIIETFPEDNIYSATEEQTLLAMESALKNREGFLAGSEVLVACYELIEHYRKAFETFRKGLRAYNEYWAICSNEKTP